ncbi:MAG TPA: CdaR family protein [Candidatus Kapabacteria bacterium]|nr:CdaR family protein [Candidatus Kapabacteria bacterium]
MTFTRSILVFFGAFIFSVLLWAYVRLSAPYEADVDLPVKISPPKGFALSSGLPERLHARVRGAGWQILLMNFTKNSRFQFDLSERVLSPSDEVIIRSDAITNSAMMPSELRVLKVEPDSLDLAFRKTVQKRIPIEPDLDVQPGRGYVIVGGPIVSPAAITVEGSPNILDSLQSFRTKPIMARNAKEDVDATVELSDSLINFVSIANTPKISVHVDIQAIGERTIRTVPIAIDALPPQYEVIFIPNTVNVTLRGGVDTLSTLSMSSVRVHVGYNPAIFDTAHAVTPNVEVPQGITFLGIDPQQVRFILRRKIGIEHAAP